MTKATFNDVVDFRDCTALNAGRLLCMSVAYTEEGRERGQLRREQENFADQNGWPQRERES